MKNVLRKDFLREIKKNKGRFLSIFFIVMLGTAFFSGVRSAGPDMNYIADDIYRRTNMMDLRLAATLGMTDYDLEDIRALSCVGTAEGGYTKEVVVNEPERQWVLKLISQTVDVNNVLLREGRLPEKTSECVADTGLSGYEIGDVIHVESGTEDEISDSLNVAEFTVVGKGSLPYYIDLTRGNGSVGSGSIDAFLVVSPEVFEADYYSEIYVRVAGADAFNNGSSEYEQIVDAAEDEIKALEDQIVTRRYRQVISEANREIEDGKTEITDGLKELEDARTELDDAKQELSDAETELDDGQKELEDGAEELTDAAEKLEDARTELDDGESQLQEAYDQLAETKETLESGAEQLQEASEQLESAYTQLTDGKAELDAAKKTLDESAAVLQEKQAELDAAHKEMDAQEAALKSAWQQLEEGEAALLQQKAALSEAKEALPGLELQLEQLQAALLMDPENPELLLQEQQLSQAVEQMKTQIGQGDAQIAAAEEQLAATRETLTGSQEALDAAKEQLAAGDEQLAAGKGEYEAGLLQYEEGMKTWQASAEAYQSGLEEYQKNLAEYESGRQQYEEGLKQYEEARQAFEDGKKEYEDGLSEYSDAVGEYKDGLQEYEDGLSEYRDGLKEYEDGEKEYQDAFDEHMPEIEDGKQEIKKAEFDLRRLGEPKLYVLDRDAVPSAVSFDEDAKRMDNLGNVFPVIFFLVAALVSLTAMTRMVEEQRQQIGTLKALGFSGRTIAWKYLKYALIPTLAGGVIGVLAGEIIIPKVIIDSYRMMYTGLDRTLTPFNAGQGILAVVLAVICTSAAALAACYRKLVERPAQLMRPEAPKNGHRVFLERIRPVWKRMNFTAKSTIRNLFRYKKRLFMTIVGIGACMGLMMVGFGLYDSITDVAKRQYKEIFMQDATVTIDRTADLEEQEALLKKADAIDGLTGSMELYESGVTLKKKDTDRSAVLYVPKETKEVRKFLRFQDRVTRQDYEFPTRGVGLSEKTAAMLGVRVGDTIGIELNENDDPVEAEVTVIVENYVQHYCFMTGETYESLFGEEPEYNSLLLEYEDHSQENEDRIGQTLLAMDACSGISFTTDFQKQIDDMLATLTKVIWVLIISAGLLAFVVLYNLNNINIMERQRELATLKVLGFRDGEVALYVYRENVFLTILGIVLGCFVGVILHQFTIRTVEVDLMMFGRTVRPASYLISAVITLLFALIVNTAMYFTLKKIDMIESLKSVE